MKSFRQPPPTPPSQGRRGVPPSFLRRGLGGGYEVVEVILCTFLSNSIITDIYIFK